MFRKNLIEFSIVFYILLLLLLYGLCTKVPLIEIKRFDHKTKIITNKNNKISKMFHNCILTNRHWVSES